MRKLVLLAGLCFVAFGCDGDGGGDNGGGGGGGSVGHCAAAMAAEACDGDCAFDPAAVDCTAACDHVATICAEGACDVQCQGMESDPMLCNAACMGTRGMHCTNLAFGCYATSADCAAVGACVEANADANLSGGGADDTAEGGGDDTVEGGGADTGGEDEPCSEVFHSAELYCGACAGTPKPVSCTGLLPSLEGCVTWVDCEAVPPGPKAGWCCPE